MSAKVIISAATNAECNAQAVDGYGNPSSWPPSPSGWWFFVGWEMDGEDVSYAMEPTYDEAIRIAAALSGADGEHLEIVDRCGQPITIGEVAP